MLKIPFNYRYLAALALSLLALYVVLVPLNAPLYDLILFPFPDPRIPDKTAELNTLRASGVTIKDVAFRSSNGRLLHGWFLESPNTKRVFLYCHAKGNNIYGKLHVATNLLMCGGSVLMYDYQGFGCSEGKPSIEKGCEDCVAGYDYLINQEGYRPRDVIAFGESFGCGVAGQLSKCRTVGGIILNSGASSLKRAGRERLVWLNLYPDWLFPKQTLDNIAVFSVPHPPLLIIHGTSDSVVTYKNAQELYDNAIPPKQLISIPSGGHCSWGNGGEVIAGIKNFLSENRI